MKTNWNYLFVILLFGCCIHNVVAQEYRSLDGTGNNLANPTWGANDGDILSIVPIAYADSISAPSASDRENPREISNTLFDQKTSKLNSHKYSDYVWVFGQFIDHDLTFLPTNANEPYPVSVPVCDEMFDPNCDGIGQIPLNRTTSKNGTGTSVDNPRRYYNKVTAFLDGSAIYGSDSKRASWLRTYYKGKLKMNDGLMPFNTTDGSFNSNVDYTAPEMENRNRYTTKVFVSGNIRANQNVNLTALQTLFVREHNRLCDELNEEHPEYSDEVLYQEAKKINVAKIQAILYYEWLPTIGIKMPVYRGYDETVNPNILLSFTSAAYRMGHTLVNSKILRMNDLCQPMASGDLNLKDAFYNPRLLASEGDIEPFLKGMSYQIQQDMDCQLNSDIRNFLFGPPEAGMGMDLAAINIQRAREMGLPDFNTIRSYYGLKPYTEFEQICPDPNVYIPLKEIYGDINNIDAWVGMLAEEHVSDAMFGETVMEILKLQFSNIRLGDRFYFENDPTFTPDEISELKQTKLRDIVMRNTQLKLMQDNVFKANPKCIYEGLNLESKDLNLYAFPNPTQDYYSLAIYAESESEVEYLTYDATGKVVDRQELTLDKGMNTYAMTLNSNLPAGIYTLTVAKGGYSQSIRIQKL